MTTDLEYIEDGMFIRFVANTKAGECAYNEMATKCGGLAAVLTVYKNNTLYQLRAAGYSVKKAKPSKMSVEDILKELT